MLLDGNSTLYSTIYSSFFILSFKSENYRCKKLFTLRYIIENEKKFRNKSIRLKSLETLLLRVMLRIYYLTLVNGRMRSQVEE